MQKTLYKYFPFRPEFLDNFLIRASTAFSLNDPFEALPSIDYFVNIKRDIREINEFTIFNEEQVRKDLLPHLDKDIRGELGFDSYFTFGIISLTECSDNLLMWSHYADEHKGFVLEFDIDNPFFSEEYSDNPSHDVVYKSDIVGKTNPVLYRKKRLDTFDSFNSLEIPYLHKSNEWLYEQEHRLILPLLRKKMLLIHEDKCDDSSFTSSPFSGPMKQISEYKHDDLVKNPDVMFMFSIPPSAIISITFGARMPIENKKKIQTIINENPDLDHLKIYEAKLNPVYYQLDIS